MVNSDNSAVRLYLMHTSLYFLSLATSGALTLYHFSFSNGADRIYNLRSHMVEL